MALAEATGNGSQSAFQIQSETLLEERSVCGGNVNVIRGVTDRITKEERITYLSCSMLYYDQQRNVSIISVGRCICTPSYHIICALASTLFGVPFLGGAFHLL